MPAAFGTSRTASRCGPDTGREGLLCTASISEKPSTFLDPDITPVNSATNLFASIAFSCGVAPHIRTSPLAIICAIIDAGKRGRSHHCRETGFFVLFIDDVVAKAIGASLMQTPSGRVSAFPRFADEIEPDKNIIGPVGGKMFLQQFAKYLSRLYLYIIGNDLFA